MVMGFWVDGREGSVENMNLTMPQVGEEADFDVSKTGVMFFELSTGQVKQSNGVSWVVRIPRNAAANVASLRTLGGGAQQAAPGIHGHTPSRVEGFTYTTIIASSSNTSVWVDYMTRTVTVAANNAISIGVRATGRVSSSNGAHGTLYARILVDGVEKVSGSRFGGRNSTINIDIGWTEPFSSAGDKVIEVEIRRSNQFTITAQSGVMFLEVVTC